MKYQRQIDMLQYIINRRKVTNSDLLKHFNISKATLNRDLRELEKTDNIEKVYGGALSKVDVSDFQMLIKDKEQLHIDAKIGIAKIACSLIQPVDTIIIDSGSTMYYFAKELLKLQKLTDLTVVTNDLKVAYTLCTHPNISIIITGGIKHSDGYDLYCDQIPEMVRSLHISKYFVATSAFDLEVGITHTNYKDVQIKKTFMSYADEVLLCADSSKEGLLKRFRIGEVKSVNRLITDDGINTDRLQKYRELGIDVLLAKNNSADSRPIDAQE